MNRIAFEQVRTVDGQLAYYVLYEGARPPHGPYRINTICNILEAALREARALPDYPLALVVKCRSCGGTKTRIRLVLVRPKSDRPSSVAVDYACDDCHATLRDVADDVQVVVGP